MRWEKKLDILGPIEQARRCLDFWLREEGRGLPENARQRAAALMARYFLHEEQVSDELMLSFLRHYSASREMDMEDPVSVRMEIKSVLDKSSLEARGKKKYIRAAIVALFFVFVGFGVLEISQKKITREQQAELKMLVRRIVEQDKTATAAGIWAEMKEPLQVRSYQDIPWWRYRGSREILEGRLAGTAQGKK